MKKKNRRSIDEGDITPQKDYTKKYLQMIRNNQTKSLDIKYGVRKFRNNFMIGNSPIFFEDDYIFLNKKSYKKTEGLIQLLFKKLPDATVITSKDLKDYGEIIRTTNAHKKYYKSDETIRADSSMKYIQYISRVIKSSKSGSGFSLPPPYKITKTNTYMDYVYWDDPNELVDRLRLLLAERAAGNQNHVNEIHSIIEELREANIIN